ncbi:helix-turn-helix domain-containing protein [Paenibacillus sp. GYB004]
MTPRSRCFYARNQINHPSNNRRGFGLTVQTVSKALKGKPGMSESTRQLVVRTAEKLGYLTKEQIRGLRASTGIRCFGCIDDSPFRQLSASRSCSDTLKNVMP